MTERKPINSCQRCGGTAYKPILEREAGGAMVPSGKHQCVQCGVVFTDVREWRGDASVPRASGPSESDEVTKG